MSKFSNFKIKWPKPVEKLENGGRLDPLRQNLAPQNGPLDPPVRATRWLSDQNPMLKVNYFLYEWIELWIMNHESSAWTEDSHRRRNSFQVGGAKLLYKDCHFSRRAPYNHLSAAQLKDIDRLRCFVVIDFHIAVFILFRNVNHFSKSTMGLWANGITHFPTAMSGFSWRKCEKTYRYAMVYRIFARLNRCRKHPLCSAGDRFQR